MPSGGRRPGAGRPRGSTTKSAEEIEAEARVSAAKALRAAARATLAEALVALAQARQARNARQSGQVTARPKARQRTTLRLPQIRTLGERPPHKWGACRRCETAQAKGFLICNACASAERT